MKKSFYASTALAVALTSLLLACGGGGGDAGKTGTGGTSGPSAGGSTGTVGSASPDQSISLSVGTGDKIEIKDDIFYRKVFAATVTDTNAKPIKGAKVTFRAEMVGFAKGYWDLGTSPADQVALDYCPNEDLNGDNIRDPGEDINGNAQLDPRISLITVRALNSDTTDSDGVVLIAVDYAKKDASWLTYRLVVSTTGVTNATEVTTKFETGTSWAEGDESAATNPFRYSRFGKQAGCNNTN